MTPIAVLLARQKSNLVEAELKRREIDRLSSYCFYKSQNFGGESPSGSPDPHSMERMIVANADLQVQYEKRVREIETERYLIQELIMSIKNARRSQIVAMRCFDGKSYSGIGQELNLTGSGAFKEYEKALQTMDYIRRHDARFSAII